MKVRNCLFVCLVFVVFVCPLTAFSSELPRIGVRGGLGTDIDLGLAFGGGVNYMLDIPNNPVELGVLAFFSSSSETEEEYGNEYITDTDVFVFAMMSNYLFGYKRGVPGMFLLAGFGLGMASVGWEERSPDDISLGTPWDGGSMHDGGGTGAGSIFSLGGGMAFSNGADIRLEIPVILIFGDYDQPSSVVPTFTITAGMRF
ncbi:outer membrane beta-barrel protein [candidate division WOR-3 bacterium]|nr:outer membrane beta-barrel protein [candidate division WOR-3 bacterium]